MLREKGGGVVKATKTKNFSLSSVKMVPVPIIVFSSDSVMGGMLAGMGLSKAPDMKFRILGFLMPAGRERGADEV